MEASAAPLSGDLEIKRQTEQKNQKWPTLKGQNWSIYRRVGLDWVIFTRADKESYSSESHRLTN